MVESISKTRLSRGTVAAIVSAAFGDATSLVAMTECDEGWFNAVYRLALSDGTTCVLKVAPPPDVRVLRYEHDIVTTEVEALRLVRERTSLPVPAVLASDASCSLVPSPYFLMEHCSGVLLSELRPALDAGAQAAVDAQLLRLLGEMHTITAPAFGRPDRSAVHDDRWSAAFMRLVTDLVADAADARVDTRAGDDELIDIVDRHRVHLDVVTTPRLVHWDLWDLNVFVDPDTYLVTGLIDFERVLWADPLIEAQFLGKRTAADVADAGKYARSLFEQPYATERRRLYDLYLYLVMLVECSYRNYPTDDVEQLARPCLAAVVDEIRSA